jgi:hypothetical protein
MGNDDGREEEANGLSVSIETLGLGDVSVIGQMGESLGIVLFASSDDFEAYLDAASRSSVARSRQCRRTSP